MAGVQDQLEIKKAFLRNGLKRRRMVQGLLKIYNYACRCSTTFIGERKETDERTEAEQVPLCYIITFSLQIVGITSFFGKEGWS
ncbi:hypothetical protein L3X38_020131 [Prunus dulcis]|uniref:Uncharacterized protein n=1 Tax=Prunus dulcis TaxID=3755 RepID=A0AAD4WEG5_PRUDU|nr:hypothetical protein L3X38_020131 [Prunus dulcis]